MQLSLSDCSRSAGGNPRGVLTSASTIHRREGARGLYRGLGVVLTGMIPKIAIRFSSFEAYKQWLAHERTGSVGGTRTFAGITGTLFGRQPAADVTLCKLG